MTHRRALVDAIGDVLSGREWDLVHGKESAEQPEHFEVHERRDATRVGPDRATRFARSRSSAVGLKSLAISVSLSGTASAGQPSLDPVSASITPLTLPPYKERRRSQPFRLAVDI